MPDVKIDGYKCNRCNHTWASRVTENKDGRPVICPKCRSPYWNRKK